MNTLSTWQTLSEQLAGELQAELGHELWQVLTNTGSLTDIVKQACIGTFSVNVLSQHSNCPSKDESDYLNLGTDEQAVIRNVLLCDDATPYVFAHSVMPLKTLQGVGKVLGDMGNKPLGAELFSNPAIRRGEIQVAVLLPEDELYAIAVENIEDKPTQIWGRRSKFYVGDNPLLVCEFFLPTWLPASPSNTQ